MLSLQTISNTLLFEKEIEKKVTVSNEALLKDICIDIMENVGLKHFSNTAKVLVKTSDFSYHTFESFVPNLEINIESLKPIFGEPLIFKILVPGKIEEFNEVELKKTFYSNFLHLLVKKCSSIKNYIADPVFKDIIESIENNTFETHLYESLFQINKAIENELGYSEDSKTPSTDFQNIDVVPSQSTTPLFSNSCINFKIENPITPISIKDNIVTSTEEGSIANSLLSSSTTIESNTSNKSSNDCHEILLNILQKTSQSNKSSNTIKKNTLSTIKEATNTNSSSSRSRICFDQNTETPILELWYQLTRTPSISQLQDYADHLNTLSNRTNNEKITSHNIKIWFKNRRAKENRVNKNFTLE